MITVLTLAGVLCASLLPRGAGDDRASAVAVPDGRRSEPIGSVCEAIGSARKPGGAPPFRLRQRRSRESNEFSAPHREHTLPGRVTGGRRALSARCRNNAGVATVTANQETGPTPVHGAAKRPDLVSVGTIVWLANELMFFAALFAMYFTIRSVTKGNPDLGPWPDAHLNVALSTTITVILVASSFTSQVGVWAAERGDVKKLRKWFIISFVLGVIFVVGQGY